MLKNIYKTLFNSKIIKGTLILTAAGFATRIIGFFFRIFLTGKIGAEGLGIYQLIFPIQIICYSICTVGFETAISKLTASSLQGKNAQALRYLKCGLVLSLTVSFVISFFVFNNSEYLSSRILLEPRCNGMIKVMSLSIPLASFHSCVCGYYLGRKKTNIPAISQLVEQLARVISIFIIITYLESIGKEITPLIAVFGSISGEIISVCFCLFHIRNVLFTKKNAHINYREFKTLSSSILSLSVPVTLNRLMLSILQSIQSILIPNMLIVYGYSSSKALGIYGILLGLVLPLIMFPGAFVNSLSLLLLPTISEAESINNTDKIKLTTEKTIKFCCLFGIYCAAIFIRFGNEIGTYVLSNNEAGTYISILGILCPFIYITSTLASIINGLGHTTTTFVFNIISTLIQIFSIVIIMPEYGIMGYIGGFLISNVLTALCLFVYTKRLIHIQLNLCPVIIYPALAMFLLIRITDLITQSVFSNMTVFCAPVSACIITFLYCMLFKKTIKNTIR